jgi:hypothetical protein
MKVMKTNDSKTSNSIPKSRDWLLFMLIGKTFITGENKPGDLNASHCNIFGRQIAKANYLRQLKKS